MFFVFIPRPNTQHYRETKYCLLACLLQIMNPFQKDRHTTRTTPYPSLHRCHPTFTTDNKEHTTDICPLGVHRGVARVEGRGRRQELTAAPLPLWDTRGRFKIDVWLFLLTFFGWVLVIFYEERAGQRGGKKIRFERFHQAPGIPQLRPLGVCWECPLCVGCWLLFFIFRFGGSIEYLLVVPTQQTPNWNSKDTADILLFSRIDPLWGGVFL